HALGDGLGVVQAGGRPRRPVVFEGQVALAQHDNAAHVGQLALDARELTDVRSVVVLRQGHLAFEYHRAPWTATSLHDTQSVTKSVLGILTGMALADGTLKRLDQPVAVRLPELARGNPDPRAAQLRFSHLLTMTAGWGGLQTSRRDRDDDLAWLTRRPFVAAPGTQFAYDNGAANLLALALERMLGQPVSAYARERLFEPLGIRRFEWAQGGHGHDLGALGLRLSTRDMALIGQLMLQEGRWGSRQLLPRDFARAATERQNAGGPPVDTAYGYLWWVAPTAPGRKADAAPSWPAATAASGSGSTRRSIWWWPPPPAPHRPAWRAARPSR
ncbi:MAG TPA: serine hydrolase, partial [Ottowia sp.]|nr:serine hydrolase [Ottowia sp.]